MDHGWVEPVNGQVVREPGGQHSGDTERPGDEFVTDSMSTRGSNDAADWLKNRGPAWNPIWLGKGALSFGPNVAEKVRIGSCVRKEGKSNFSSEGFSGPV